MTEQGREAARRIQDEHRHLRDVLGSAEGVFAARTADRGEVVTLVESLRRELLDHFVTEETGGYFSEAIAAAPRLSDRAERLLAEHGEFREQLDALLSIATTGNMDESWWDELGVRFRRLARQLNDHEIAETRLLQEAYLDDLGASD